MANEKNDNASKYDGLAPEVGKILRDREFKNTIKMLQPNPTKFRIIKGFGFMLVLASGLFGYFLKANSEAEDRRASALTQVINEKKDWLRRINNAILELRKIRADIILNCKNKDPQAQYKTRLDARYELIRSYAGIAEIFGIEIANTLDELVRFDDSIKNICSPEAPGDDAWLAFAKKANQQMRESLKRDREDYARLSEGIFKNSFPRL